MSDFKILEEHYRTIFSKLKPDILQKVCDHYRESADEARKEAEKNKDFEGFAKEMEQISILAERAITKCTSTKNDEETSDEETFDEEIEMMNKVFDGLTIATYCLKWYPSKYASYYYNSFFPPILAVRRRKKTSEK